MRLGGMRLPLCPLHAAAARHARSLPPARTAGAVRAAGAGAGTSAGATASADAGTTAAGAAGAAGALLTPFEVAVVIALRRARARGALLPLAPPGAAATDDAAGEQP